MSDNRNARVWAAVAEVPEGMVATYKQIAALVGIPGPSGPRQVGYALAQMNDGIDVPWHRIINSRGELSPRANPDAVLIQRDLLEAEGVEFDLDGRIDLAKYAWHEAP